MSGAWGVQTEEIIEWASRYEAAAVLPELVRRLLLATAHVEHVEQFELLEMRTGAGVREPGYDGIVVARAASPFCPQGVSAWELSTESDPKRKATSDIRKREKKSPAPIVPADATYVAVTAQRFRDKHRWANEQLRRGAWRGVKVIDADDLSMWIGQCPAVAHWFMAEQLGRPIFGWRDVRSWRRRWEQRTSPALPGELVLIDRGPQVAELRRWLEGLEGAPGSVLRIRAEHRDEACLFLAVVVTAGEAEGADEGSSTWWSSIRARTLVVETKDAWRVATALDTSVPLILVPAFADLDPADRSARHAMVIPMDPSQGGASPMEIRIDEPLPWREMVGWLSKVLPVEQAEQKARESGGRLTALSRSLEGMAAPAWALEQPRTGLVAMVFMGAWEPKRTADRDVAKILGIDPDELDALCVELTKVTEPPVTREGRGWRWVSHADAWRVLCDTRSLADSDLDRFREIAGTVLGEDDPRYELPKDERWSALVRGKALACSEMLRGGVAESLVRLALADPQLTPSYHESKGAPLVEGIVEDVLGPHWVRWASLSELLPVLAEAAPRAFLKALEASLDRDDGVERLLHEGDGSGLGHAPHTGLLWALETLGWDEAIMPRVAHALADLAEQDPGEGHSNRPLASLEALFDLVVPQTLANEPTRQEALVGIVGAPPEEPCPRVGWPLLLGLIRDMKGRFLPRSRRPRFLPWPLPPEQDMPTLATVHARLHPVLDHLLRVVGTDCERWATLIDGRLEFSLPDADSQRVFSTLIARKPSIKDPGARIWNALRQRLDYVHQLGSPASPEHVGLILERLTAAYEAFTPSDPVVAALPLFRAPYYLPEPHDRGARMGHRISELQQDFLRRLASRDDREQLLDDLVVSLAPELHALGFALAQSPLADEMEQRLLHDEPPEAWRGLIRGFAVCLRPARGFEWFARTVRRLATRGRVDDAVSAALGLTSESALWDLLDELGEPILGEYWRAVDVISMGDHSDPAHHSRALERLLRVGNAKVALELASWKAESIPTQLLVEVLETVARADASVHRSPSFTYQVTQVFETLEKRDDVDVGQAAALESDLAIQEVGESSRIPYFLDRVLRDHPEEFARYVALGYPPRYDTNAVERPALDATEEDRARSHWAYYVLDSWSYPGSDIEDPDQREAVVYEWAERALTLTREAHRRDVGEREVAEVLARVRPAADGYWPCLAARRLLERGRQYPYLARAMTLAKYNQWGRHMRVVDDGNEQTTLTERYIQAAIALGKRWPRTAAMLDDLADMHRTGAERDAKRAHEDRIAGGYPRHPTQTVRIAPPAIHGDQPVIPKEASIIAGLRCTAVGPAPSLSVDFGDRLNLITGDNGLGKTFLLDVAWWALTGSWVEGKLARPFGGADLAVQRAEIQLMNGDDPLSAAWFDARHERWDRPLDWPRTDALVVYARVDGGFSVWDPELMTMGSTDPESSALDISKKELWDGVERGDVVLCKGLLADWIGWQSRNPDVFARFFGLVRALFEGDVAIEPGGFVPRSLHDDREVPTIKLPYDEVRVDLLSAGMKRVLGLAYVIQWALGRHRRARKQRTLDTSPWSVVLLFDEVEAHLHPRWQRTILPTLLRQLEQLGGELTESQVIATTHAPFVAASCEPIFDPDRDELFVFEEHEKRVVVMNVDWAKHGSISNWATSRVFGLGRSRSLEAEQAIDAALAFMRGDPTGDPELRTREEIHARLSDVLADGDEFWAHWLTSMQDGAAQ